jgi:TolA-binding protein
LSRKLLAALLGATLLVAQGATAAMAAAPADSDRIDAVKAQVGQITPELTKLTNQVQDALASFEGTAAALAEEAPTTGRPDCELDEAARLAALEQLSASSGAVLSRFTDASEAAIGRLQAAADGFVAEIDRADSADAVKASFQSFEAALTGAARAGGAEIDAASAGVEDTSRAGTEALAAACAPQDEIDRISSEAASALGVLAQADGALQAALPVVLGQLDEAEQAILDGLNDSESESDQDQEATTTTIQADDGGDDDSDGEVGTALPFTGAAMIPLLIFGVAVAGVGAALVVAGRRKGVDSDSSPRSS